MGRKGGKYRSKGVKREHNIIHGLLPVLEEIGASPLVSAVIPGRIRVTQGNISGVKLRVQTRTVTGIKLGARSGNAAQEVFIVTSAPDDVVEFLRASIPELEA